MFYVLIFSIAAVILVVSFISTVTRRRRELARGEAYESPTTAYAAHNEHATHGQHSSHGDTERRTRKAKRAQSKHDRRKRH
jgi:hypothetical protein